MIKVKSFVQRMLKPSGKHAFIRAIAKGGKILDVGCGNNSPYLVKTLRPDIYYVGLDVGVYNQTSDYTKYANEFILTGPEEFASKIEERPNEFDAVICSHNLEHCNDYAGVTSAMLKSLKKGGIIYIAFPCEASVHFPKRAGCLNFYDDDSHKNVIPYASFIDTLNQNGMSILFASARYRPVLPFIIGFLFEPFGRFFNKPAPAAGTWAFYGFETVIIARRN